MSKSQIDVNISELECEDLIMKEKERFGRVRTGIMKQLRTTYGKEVANKALSRINKRLSQGSLRIKQHINPYSFENKGKTYEK